MKFEKLSNKIIAISSAAAVIIATVAYFGFQVETPTDALNKHVEQSAKLHLIIDTRLESAEKNTLHLQYVETLLEGILRGECIENPRQNLARQGLLAKCKELGISR